MKVNLSVLLLVSLFSFQQVKCNNLTAYTSSLKSFGPDTTGFKNPGFEQWVENRPEYWNEVTDTIGVVLNNVVVTVESILKTEGLFSAMVSSIQPSSGISHAVKARMPKSWNIYPLSGKAGLHYAKENGTSAYFDPHERVQTDFELDNMKLNSSAIRNAHALRIDNGDYIELFSASASCEATYHGAIYMKRNGGDPALFMEYPGHKTWTWPGVIDLETKYVFVTMRFDSLGKQRLFATDISRDFKIATNDRLLFEIDSTNVQCYNMVNIDNQIILPIVYAKTNQVSSGPWFLDIITTSDFETVQRLNQPITYPTKGLMEAQPVLLSDNTVAILCRTNKKHLAKAIYDPLNRILHPAIDTQIAQPESGSYAKNLSDNSILLSWLTGTRLRKILVMAVSNDDMATWQSYHVIMTSAALGHDITTIYPYIHQPFIFEDYDGSLICYFEEVISTSDINLYKTRTPYFRIENIANELNEWQEIYIERPFSAATIQLLNTFNSNGLACFDQPGIIDVAILPTGLKIYPNPVIDVMYISSEKPITHIELIDLNGRLIKDFETDVFTNDHKLLMEDLTPGMYLLKLTCGEDVSIFKVIKSR